MHVIGGVLEIPREHKCAIPTEPYSRGTYAWCDVCDTIWWKTTHPMYAGWWKVDMKTRGVLEDRDWRPFGWRKLRWWLAV